MRRGHTRRCHTPGRAGTADRRAETKAARICTPGNSQAAYLVPPGHRRGAGARCEASHQRGAPSLAQGGVRCDPRNLASAGGDTQSRAQQGQVEELAGGAFGEDHLARRAAAFEDAPGLGQPRRAPQRRAFVVDVCEGHHGTLHAARRQLAEHERVYPAHPRQSGALRGASTPARADHRVAGGRGAGMESGPDTL